MEFDRKYDIIIWGATGFTGSLVAEYFTSTSPESIVWALGGRNEEKMKELRARLGKINTIAEKVEIVTGDSLDQASMDEVVKQTRVILSTVGPFSLYGTPLVDACVRNGTHYCDITGESIWVREIIDKYHNEAEEKGICIVPMCGFDSIPADLGCLFINNHIKEKWHRTCSEITAYVQLRSKPSGATIASIFSIFELPKEKKQKMYDTHLLSRPMTSSKTIKAKEKDQIFPKYSSSMKTWTIPFLMAQVNTRVVRRSHFLMSDDDKSGYAPNFVYNECEQKKGILLAFITWFIFGILIFLMEMSLFRRILKKFVPKQGEGPSKSQRAKSWFKYNFEAKIGPPLPGTEEELIPSCPSVLQARISGGDPGYNETAKMVSEAAITLALGTKPTSGEFSKERISLVTYGGVLTPASCMGMTLVERLQKAGLNFEILSV